MNTLRTGVIGAGHLGRIHTKLLGQVDGADLVAVSDPSTDSLARIDKASIGRDVFFFSDYRSMLDQVDAVVVASPTPTHAGIVDELLDAGKHVFCEKPLTIDGVSARRLAMTASRRNLTLQVGHVERFNPAFTALGDLSCGVKYVEAVRASSFPGRCLDVGVVMDLMIHDLDLILSLAEGAVAEVRASGTAVISDHEDIAEARVEFECGLIANVRASRLSPSPTRSMQVYSDRGMANIDFSGPSLSTIRTSDAVRDRTFDLDLATDNPLTYRDTLFAEHLRCDSQQLTSRNAILDELHDFVLSVHTGSTPVVDGHAAAAAVDLAERIVGAIQQQSGMRSPAVGMPQRRVA